MGIPIIYDNIIILYVLYDDKYANCLPLCFKVEEIRDTLIMNDMSVLNNDKVKRRSKNDFGIIITLYNNIVDILSFKLEESKTDKENKYEMNH